MVKVYDRNRNQIVPGQRVMIAQSGVIDVAKAIHADGMSAVQAERRRLSSYCIPVNATFLLI